MKRSPGSWLAAALLCIAACLFLSCETTAPSAPVYHYDEEGHWCDGGEKEAHRFEETVVLPTCTGSGYTLHRCVCGYSFENAAVPPLGHTFSDTLTYDETGHWYPAVCGHTDEKKDFEPHDYTIPVRLPTCRPYPDEMRYKPNIEVTPPTCTKGGYTTHFCTCGHTYRSDFTEPTGHTFSDTLTYDETGHWYPAVCGHDDEKKDFEPHCYYTETNKAPTCRPPLIVRTENEIVTPPTETEEGYTTHFCACGYSYRDSFVPPTGQTAPTAAMPVGSDGKGGADDNEN